MSEAIQDLKVGGRNVMDGEEESDSYKQRLLSLDMKTKLVQHVESD